MKTRAFIGVAMVAFTLLSCNEFASDGDDSNISLEKEVGSGGTSPEVYDPFVPFTIKDDVQQWINEQLASKNNERRQITISEMYRPELKAWLGLSATIDSKGNVKYFSKDREISAEEYKSIEETTESTWTGKRNLSIPGEIISAHNTCIWEMLMTAEEIVELSKKYDNLLIGFRSEYQNL